MVYVVERYLPGLSRSDLLNRLARLERAQELRGEAPGVRYLGSTVVLEDEACFCQFEGPTEAAVAEANRRADLPFDRIVSAVTVQPERRNAMSVSATIPATVQIRRGSLIGLVVGAAVLAAAVTWAVSAFALDTGTASTQESVSAQPAVLSSPIPMTGYLDAITSKSLEQPLGSAAIPATGYLDAITTRPSAREQKALKLVNSLTPAQLRSIRYYWAPTTTQLGPREQRALDLVNSLTPAQHRGIRYYWTPSS